MGAKLLVLYGPPTDPAALDAHYLNVHLRLVKAVPGLPSATSNSSPVGSPVDQRPTTRSALPNVASGGTTLLVFDEHEV